MRLFSFAPYSVRSRENCTVGALRREAEGHDISIVSYGARERTMTSIGDFAAGASALNTAR
jgi:hypothetical protein